MHSQILLRVKSNCMTSGHGQYSVLFFITHSQMLSVNLISGVKCKFALVKMAASIMVWDGRWPVHKSLIREALSERIGKMFKIVHSKKHLNGRICKPVFILYTTKYDTRMVCEFQDSGEYLPVYCNELVPYPLVMKSPLSVCSIRTPLLTVQQIKRFLNTAVGSCDKRAHIWARREMVKSMLLEETFPPFPCNKMPIFNKAMFPKSLIIAHQTAIKVQGGCPFEGVVDFKRFGEGLCFNDHCFYCSCSKFEWGGDRTNKILHRFDDFLTSGLCHLCIHQRKIVDKENRYGGLVKFAKEVFDLDSHTRIKIWEEDSDDDSFYSISSEESDLDKLEFWDEDFTDPPLHSRSLVSC